MLAILLSLVISDQIDSTKVKETTHPSYNVMAYNTEDVKRRRKKVIDRDWETSSVL